MTKASEVTVSDAEVEAFYNAAYAPEGLQFEAHRQALAAFLAPRLAAERERCAKVAERFMCIGAVQDQIARAIRALT